MTTPASDKVAYTLGLLAGEGSFFVTFTRDQRYNHNLWYGPKVAVSMGEYSQEMLIDQQERYDLGTVNKHPKGYTWTLSSRSDCHELRQLIDDYHQNHGKMAFTHTPKFRSYQSWCEALDLLKPGRSLSKNEVLELAEIRDDINYIRATTHIPTEEIEQALTQE